MAVATGTALAIGGAISAATGAYGAYASKRAADDVPTDAELKNKANREAEKGRLARAGKQEGSETIFKSNPAAAAMGAAPLKKKLGA